MFEFFSKNGIDREVNISKFITNPTNFPVTVSLVILGGSALMLFGHL